MDHTEERSISVTRENTVKLTDVSFERIRAAMIEELYDLSVIAGIQDDERLVHCEDLRERLILVKRKMEGSSHSWKELFQSVREETQVKSESLYDLMQTVEATFKTCPHDSLSEILRKEGHVHSQSLLQELSKRMKNLKERRSLVVIAGETNGGKSSFLNLLLGVNILPTDVLHCTFSVCKIVYSDTYSIKTLDYYDQVEHFPCGSLEEVRVILQSKLAKQEMKERLHGSTIKEVTLGLPADILKSGVTLVDTPGIGENEHMDNVTMNFVKSTHASAFIYIIKSDTAGGIQEDRLLSFLRAIKERYSGDTEIEAFDPRAAMFVCHRWDNIEEHNKDKVKQNALQKLEFVWPGFQQSQIYFFSTTDTMKHFPVDPEFVTDSFMTLLKGMKQLFDRASHNAIKHQYLWLKHMLPPASHYLKSMITHCTHNNEELELYFHNVVQKQNKLMTASTENSRKLQDDLNALCQDLKAIIMNDLHFDTISVRSEINDCDEIITVCSADNFLSDKANRWLLDEMIIRSLLKYVDEHIHDRNIVTDMEAQILSAIQDHLGLFKCQISQIKFVLQHGGSFPLTPSSSRTNMEVDDLSSQFGASTWSMGSNHSSLEAFREDTTLDTSKLALQVNLLLVRRKGGKSLSSVKSKHDFQESLLSKVKNKIKDAMFHKMEPAVYVEERIRKVSRDIRDNAEIMNNIVSAYTEWIQRCVSYATNSIPKFIEVNNMLMEEIREHRNNFQRDKDLLKHVMDALEPCRHNLRGYGLLYMDDINAEMLAFNVSQRNSSVIVPRDLVADYKPNDDSGFLGSGSKQRHVQSLWAKMQGATFKINNEAERVIVRSYIYDMDERALLSEIAFLRCLDHTNLASFLGMTRIKATGSTRCQNLDTDNIVEKVSAFIFKGDLISANVYSKRKLTNMQLFVPDLIHNLLQGLNYIHREGLVHMELNLDTVMVERITGNVKLCQMCKPREARFPTSFSTITRTCICLSPNVLQGHEYESTDDIYAFGLLLWELLFPEQPPYKEQRTWPLKRFIDECHPTNMLQDDLMKLDVTEDVFEVLKGTLLVSRKNICMPIATVQSLMTDISNEPAVTKLRSRHEQHPIRGMSPAHRSVTSELLAKYPIDKLPTVSKPQRPPRQTDKRKSFSTTKLPEDTITKSQLPSKNSRRQSAPAIFTDHPLTPVQTSKTKFSRIFDVLLGRGFTKTEAKDKVQDPDDSVSVFLNNNQRASPATQDHTDAKGHASTRARALNPPLKSNMTSQNAGRGKLPNSKPHSRRFSIQDQSLLGPRKTSLTRDESFDVPILMSQRFSKNSSNMLYTDDRISLNSSTASDFFLSDSTSSDFFLSDSTSSHQLSDSSSKSSTPDIGQTFLYTTTRSNLTPTVSKVNDEFMLLDSKRGGHSLPGKITRHLGLASGRSLEDISPRPNSDFGLTSESARQVPHPRAAFQQSHNRRVPLRQHFKRSLQDISSVSHVIEPIMEDKVEVSDYCELDGHDLANHKQANRLFSSYEHRRLSPTEVFRQPLILTSPFRAEDALTEENVGSSSSLASTYSSSSLSVSSGCCIDVSDSAHTINLSDSAHSINVSDSAHFVNVSDSAHSFNMSDSAHSISVSDSAHSISASTRRQTDPPWPTNYAVAYSDLTTNSTASHNTTAVMGCLLRDDQLPADNLSQLMCDNDTSQLATSVRNNKEAPPPPEINFSKLTFNNYDSSDEEEFQYV